MYYAHFEDLVEGFVGPFNTVAECDQHAQFCKERGDGSTYHGAVQQLPANAFVVTPEADKAFVY